MNHALIVALIQNTGCCWRWWSSSSFWTPEICSSTVAPDARRLRQRLIGIVMIRVSAPLETGIVSIRVRCCSRSRDSSWGPGRRVIAMVMTAAFHLMLGGAPAGPEWPSFWLPARSAWSGGACSAVPWRMRRGANYMRSDSSFTSCCSRSCSRCHGRRISRRASRGRAGYGGHPSLPSLWAPSSLAGSGITARRRNSKSETRFRLLAENARDLIFRYEFTPKRGFAYVSPSSTSFTGYTPEEHYADPDLAIKMVHPEDRPVLEAARAGDTGSASVMRWIRKAGEIFWARRARHYIFDERGTLTAAEGITRDITGSRQAEELRLALKAAKQGFTTRRSDRRGNGQR